MGIDLAEKIRNSGVVYENEGQYREAWVRCATNIPETIGRWDRREPFSATLKKDETMMLGSIKSSLEQIASHAPCEFCWDSACNIARQFLYLSDCFSRELGNGIPVSVFERQEKDMLVFKHMIEQKNSQISRLIDENCQMSEMLAAIYDEKIAPKITGDPHPTKIGGMFEFGSFKTMPAVYFLIRDGVVVYVGQSEFYPSRIRSHERDSTKEFDTVYVMPCPQENLLRWENALIALFSPEYNRGPRTGVDADCVKHALAEIFVYDEFMKLKTPAYS